MKFRAWIPALLLVTLFSNSARAQDATMTVKVDQPGVKISPILYGLMTEEINYSYDGGLYGELIRNREFKGAESPRAARGGRGRGPTTAPATPPPPPPPVNPLAHWMVAGYKGGAGMISLETEQPLNEFLGNSLKLDASSIKGDQRVGITNDGYWGIPVRPNNTYRASFYARASEGFKGPLTVAIESNDGTKVFAQADVPQITTQWAQYHVNLTTSDVKESGTNRFVISTGTPGVVWFNLVSLFPPTFNNRANGNRIDIMQDMAAMNPSFLRFPGGNYVEGNDLENVWNWKKTIGDVSQRPTHLSPWNYRSDDGMGLMEYMNWCEDLHMQPVLAVFAGYSLGGRYVATGDALKPWVQDALDELEYLTGDASTPWGARRAADGHPAPFTVNYVEIGNEDGLGGGAGPRTYEERFDAFFDGIRAKYPKIQIISTARLVKNRKPDLVDDHYYRNHTQMERDTHHYDPDRYSRTTQLKVFVGEWATREGNPTPNLSAALGDAAWMTGMERNSDVVLIHSYAPLFVNVSQTTGVNPSMQWPTDLIGYDVLNSYGSPSYYAQVMFSNNRGDTVLPVELTGEGADRSLPPATQPADANQSPTPAMFATASRVDATGQVIVKFVNAGPSPAKLTVTLQGVQTVSGGTEDVLSGQLTDVNSVAEPTKVEPKTEPVAGAGVKFTHEFPANSITVMRLDAK